jgi:membrane-bound lytic murein transglycosylase F
MELDPNKWSSLEKTLPLLSKRKYYKDAIYGYARGRQPVEYIRNLMIFYDILIHLELRNAPDVTANT